tara:strand:+ start:13438 stop:14919 length:1482 start_codon:yes stop_codon:yes gene_type:complete
MNRKRINQKNIHFNSIKREPLSIYILKRIAPAYKNDIIDPFNSSFFTYPFKPTSTFSIESFYLSAFYYKNKMEIYKELRNNLFVSEKQKLYLKDIFFKLQFILRNLNLFSRKIMYRNKYRIKIHNHNEDLKLISLDSYHPRFIIEITENRTIYKFVIFDLLEIIRSSLTYTYALFCEPRKPKNPFTNLEISDANLYNIYFFAKQLDIIFCILFHAFYKSKFNTETFLLDYEPMIRDNIIENFYKNSSETKKYKDCIEFLEVYKKSMKGIIIHKDFPKKLIYEKFKPFLKMNLYIQYSYSPSKRIYYKKLLTKSLRLFVKENPMFGRIIIKPKIQSKFKFLNNIPQNQTLTQTIIQNQPENQNYIIRNYNHSFNTSHDYAEEVSQSSSPVDSQDPAEISAEMAADLVANAITSVNANISGNVISNANTITNQSPDSVSPDSEASDSEASGSVLPDTEVFDDEISGDEISGDEVFDDDPPTNEYVQENTMDYDSS